MYCRGAKSENNSAAISATEAPSKVKIIPRNTPNRYSPLYTVDMNNLAEVGIPASQVMKMIYRLVRFPFPQKCVHAVALDLLNALEENGLEPTPEFVALVRAVGSASEGNEDAEDILVNTFGVK